MFRHGSIYITVVAWLLSGPLATASEIGRQIANRVDTSVYRHFLDDLLYTHDGHDRGVGGPEHDPARDNIADTLASFGLEVTLHAFSSSTVDGVNVVATQYGSTYPDAQFVIGAHYDSANNPGADDDASGVAAVLEIARILSLYETEYTIKFIAFDAEEWGLIGSTYYVRDHLQDDVRGMVQLDMIAWDYGVYGSSICSTSSNSLPIQQALGAAISEYGRGLQSAVRVMGRSDHVPFEQAGFQACLLIEAGFGSNPCYHRACDSVDTPDYISYLFASDMTRSVAGFLADNALAIGLWPCLGDLDADADVDLSDLGLMLAAFGISADGDIDHDGDTDLADLGILLANFGNTCP